MYFLHNHSALFLSFSLLIVLVRLAAAWHPLSSLVHVGRISTFFYAIWYPYKSMRRYYGQGRAFTLIKYILIAYAYLVCLLLTLVGTVLLSALED